MGKVFHTGYSIKDDSQDSRLEIYATEWGDAGDKAGGDSDVKYELITIGDDQHRTCPEIYCEWCGIDEAIGGAWGQGWDLQYDDCADERNQIVIDGVNRKCIIKKPPVYITDFDTADQKKIADLLLTYFSFLGDPDAEADGADVIQELTELYTSLR